MPDVAVSLYGKSPKYPCLKRAKLARLASRATDRQKTRPSTVGAGFETIAKRIENIQSNYEAFADLERFSAVFEKVLEDCYSSVLFMNPYHRVLDLPRTPSILRTKEAINSLNCEGLNSLCNKTLYTAEIRESIELFAQNVNKVSLWVKHLTNDILRVDFKGMSSDSLERLDKVIFFDGLKLPALEIQTADALFKMDALKDTATIPEVNRELCWVLGCEYKGLLSSYYQSFDYTTGFRLASSRESALAFNQVVIKDKKRDALLRDKQFELIKVLTVLEMQSSLLVKLARKLFTVLEGAVNYMWEVLFTQMGLLQKKDEHDAVAIVISNFENTLEILNAKIEF